MSIIVWIIIGGLAGWVAGMIMKEQGSLVKNIIVGIVGALIGGFIMSFFGAATLYSRLPAESCLLARLSFCHCAAMEQNTMSRTKFSIITTPAA